MGGSQFRELPIFLSPHPFRVFFPKTLEVTRKSRIFAEEKLHSAN